MKPLTGMSLEKGALVISIDHEFAWGYADYPLTEARKALIRAETDILRRLLALFEIYEIPATFAIVGHLLETHCDRAGAPAHPEYPRPIALDGSMDWFAQHPKPGEAPDTLWFDTEAIIPAIAQARVGHEIGSHSYSHLPYGEEVTTRGAIEADLANMRRIHHAKGHSFASFVFPRNLEGFHDLLAQAGITQYRGNSPKWHERLPRALHRITHLLDYFLPRRRTVLPLQHASGMINIPDSLLLLGRNGLRRLILPQFMARLARRGLEQAAKRREIFHLWFHPSNFSYRTDEQFAILEEILVEARTLRERGELETLTMGAVAARCRG